MKYINCLSYEQTQRNEEASVCWPWQNFFHFICALKLRTQQQEAGPGLQRVVCLIKWHTQIFRSFPQSLTQWQGSQKSGRVLPESPLPLTALTYSDCHK